VGGDLGGCCFSVSCGTGIQPVMATLVSALASGWKIFVVQAQPALAFNLFAVEG